MFIFVAIKWYRSDNKSYEGNDTVDPDVNFEQLVCQAGDGENEDWGLCSWPTSAPNRTSSIKR